MASAAQRVSLLGRKRQTGRARRRAEQIRADAASRSSSGSCLTATMCLLAFGAVMVYSASSATSLLQGEGDGTGDLIKYVLYGAVGLVLMRVLARDGVAKVQSITGPLLAVSFVLVLATHVPHLGVERQRRAALDRAQPSCSSSPRS